MNIVEDNAFLNKAGTLLEEEDPDKSESNYIDLKTKFNLKKILVSRNCSLAVSFLKRTYTYRYRSLWPESKNQYTRGTDQYPKDVTAAYNILLNYMKQYVGNNQKRPTDNGDKENMQT